MKLNKSLGQNFIKSKKTASDIVKNLDITNINDLIEIGGGGGIITNELVKKIYQDNKNIKLTIFEIDRFFAAKLYDKFTNIDIKVELKNENFLKTSLDQYNNFSVIGAIPYYITSPIIHKLLKLQNRPKQIVLVVQYEVSKKLTSKKDDYNYWNHITLGYKVSYLQVLKKYEFDPPPEVDSAIIKFDLEDLKIYDDNFTFDKWSKFLHHAHKNPRKMLNKAFDVEMLQKAGIDPTLRPQNIETEQWLRLYNLTYFRNTINRIP